MTQHTRALVTGGAGFIGSHLSRTLLDRGIDVTVLDNLIVGKEENIPDGATFIKGDVRSASDVATALDGVSIVFHEAALVSIRSSLEKFYDDADVNLMGSLNLLRSCIGSDVKKIVLASSMAVYADCGTPDPVPETQSCEPLSPYGIAKHAAEKYLLQFAANTGTDCIGLRYFNTYGAGQTFSPYVGVITIFIRHLLEKKQPTIFGDGEQRRDFIHVSDIVAANLLAMDSDIRHGIYNVGTGKATSVNRIAELLCERIAPEIEPVHTAPHPGELRNSIADISRISADMGYSPNATLEEKIDDVIEFYKNSD